MIRHTGTWALAMAALICTGSLRAHHSVSMFDISTAIWVDGTVVSYEPVNPHAMIELEERRADGHVQRWTIEGPSSHRLNRILSLSRTERNEDFLQVGDVIEVCGFALKEEWSARRADASSPLFVHGHMLVRPDGRRHTWGPYGGIVNCVRANDQTEPWLDFLNTDPLARDFWCRRGVGVSSQVSKALVDELNSRMTNPCS